MLLERCENDQARRYGINMRMTLTLVHRLTAVVGMLFR